MHNVASFSHITSATCLRYELRVWLCGVQSVWVLRGCPRLLSAIVHAWLVHPPETYDEHVIARWYVYCIM